MIYKHYEAVGHTALHGKKCFFDPKKMTDRKDWVQELMEKNGVQCKDNE